MSVLTVTIEFVAPPEGTPDEDVYVGGDAVTSALIPLLEDTYDGIEFVSFTYTDDEEWFTASFTYTVDEDDD